jgi:ubiquitin-conjugating enzyme E2 Q
VLSLSIRIVRLGLSEEALQAWDLEPQHYIVLLIRYMNGYKSFESIISESAKSLDISFRVGVSKQYKPTLVEALAAFTDITKDGGSSKSNSANGNGDSQAKSSAGFSNMFISSSLNDFINGQFISLLKIRNSLALPYDGAKRWFNDKQGRFDQEAANIPEYYYQDTTKDNTLPNVVTADHLTDQQSLHLSFPLLAAQFCMRYLTRCTEFCLVCHDKMEENFEALKPYGNFINFLS